MDILESALARVVLPSIVDKLLDSVFSFARLTTMDLTKIDKAL